MTTPRDSPPPAIADSTLAALALVEQVGLPGPDNVAALLESTDPREIASGLYCISGLLIKMLAQALSDETAQVLPADVVDSLRAATLELVNTGRTDPRPVNFNR